MQLQDQNYPSDYKPLNYTDSDSLYAQSRLKFIQKVYTILSIQVAITFATCLLSYNVPGILEFQVDNYWLMIVASIGTIPIAITIFCCPAGRKHPVNIILLLIFTLLEAYIVSYITSIVAYNQGTPIVVIAALMTLGIFLALTAYACLTKNDFTTSIGIIIVLLVSLLFLAIFSLFYWTPFLQNLYCTIAIILFGIYIVIDTQMILGGKRIQIQMDQYVVGALMLYLDIINMFLYLLQLLSKK